MAQKRTMNNRATGTLINNIQAVGRENRKKNYQNSNK
jgi:hypothetical protein